MVEGTDTVVRWVEGGWEGSGVTGDWVCGPQRGLGLRTEVGIDASPRTGSFRAPGSG